MDCWQIVGGERWNVPKSRRRRDFPLNSLILRTQDTCREGKLWDKTEKRAWDNDRNFSFGDLSLVQTTFTPLSGLRNHRDNCYCLQWPPSDHHQRRTGKGGKERNGDVFQSRRWWRWWFYLMVIAACFLPSHHLEGGHGSCWSSSSLIADVILCLRSALQCQDGYWP